MFFGPRPTGAGSAYGARRYGAAPYGRVRQSLDNYLRLAQAGGVCVGDAVFLLGRLSSGTSLFGPAATREATWVVGTWEPAARLTLSSCELAPYVG
jgi:hypothetical protein